MARPSPAIAKAPPSLSTGWGEGMLSKGDENEVPEGQHHVWQEIPEPRAFSGDPGIVVVRPSALPSFPHTGQTP